MEGSKALCVVSVALLTISLLASAQVNNGSSEAGSATGEHFCSYTWFFWNKSSQECECGFRATKGITCNQVKKEVQLHPRVCMTYNNTTRSTAAGYCPYSGLHKLHVGLESNYVLLPQNISQLNGAVCGGANREGLLCSKCKPGYGPALLSYGHMCAKCSDSHLGWFLYLCQALLPSTIFFIFIALCQVHTTSAPLNTFILACQIASVSASRYPQQLYWSSDSRTAVGIFATFVTMWNLDFFLLVIPPFCVSEHISNLQVLSMEYIVAIYPLLLTVVMYICIQQHGRGCRVLVCLWKPFGYCFANLIKRCKWNPATSIVHTFSSFLLLSSTKILFVSISILQQVSYSNFTNSVVVSHESQNVLYYDPTLTLFSDKHIPYAVLAIFVSAIFVILPCAVLVLYPTRIFQKCLNHCGIKLHAIHAFADAFNGCYKNGTNGTCDCRCFAGFYLFIRVIVLLVDLHYTQDLYAIKELTALSILFTFALASPYKNKLFNITDSFALLLIVCKVCIRKYQHVFDTIIAAYLLLYFIALMCCKLTLKLNCRYSQKLMAIADKMSVKSNDHRIEREAGDIEDNLPDRMVNPEGYRLLSEANKETQQMTNNVRNVPTYGII